MPKQIKGLAGRTPPEPSSGHDVIDEWMRRQMPDLHDMVQRIDELIRATQPDLYYTVSRKRAYYGLADQGWIIEIAAYDVSVNVVFFGGADFVPPPPLGSVDRTRYLKLTTVSDVERLDLRDWIEQAGRTLGWR